jgi:hypothetical protein
MGIQARVSIRVSYTDAKGNVVFLESVEDELKDSDTERLTASGDSTGAAAEKVVTNDEGGDTTVRTESQPVPEGGTFQRVTLTITATCGKGKRRRLRLDGAGISLTACVGGDCIFLTEIDEALNEKGQSVRTTTTKKACCE